MENFWKTIEETPFWVYGAIGAAAFGYRAIRKSKDPKNLDRLGYRSKYMSRIHCL
jgi:hypothetical protein